jgi:branched-chain amino acid transport system substrate-binding protein
MLKAKRPDIQIVGDELHPLLKITDFAPYVAKIKASGRRQRHHRQLGAGLCAAAQGRRRRRAEGELVHLLRGGTGGPTAIKQANLNHQVFQIAEGIPNLGTIKPSAGRFEKALRAKYDFSLFYPRAVNEMRMFAAAAEKAKSLDPVKVAASARRHEVRRLRRRQGHMRKDDHQFFQPMYISSFGERTRRSRSTRKRPAGAGSCAKIDTARPMLPTTCKMERPN